VIRHLPRSQDLAWAEIFLFPKVKLALKGEHFSDSNIQHGVSEQLKGVSLQDIQCAFKGLYKLPQHCVELGADCIEIL
jgi:hypothetical protein